MRMPLSPRIGFWGNYGFHKPFRQVGFWVGEQLPEYNLGQQVEQELEEGILTFRVGVLYHPEETKQKKLETILILVSQTQEILDAMWTYSCWKQETENANAGRERQDGARDTSSDDQVVAPW